MVFYWASLGKEIEKSKKAFLTRFGKGASFKKFSHLAKAKGKNYRKVKVDFPGNVSYSSS